MNPFLDVFGVPPRITGSWQKRVRGLFADRQTVAEMKRTRRRKDWDQAAALGLQMIKAGKTEARSATLLGLDPALAAYLPEIQLHFANLFV